MELEMHSFSRTDTRSVQSAGDHHFFHTNVFLRHASGASGEAGEHIDGILTQAAAAKTLNLGQQPPVCRAQAVDVCSRPLRESSGLGAFIRSLATLVTPDPNTKLRGRVSATRHGNWPLACVARTKSRE
jgi:hypothetical protein